MMTSRSEHRLRLREGTSAWRLAHHGHRLGLVSTERLEQAREDERTVRDEAARLERSGGAVALRRPGSSWASVTANDGDRPELSAELVEAVEVEVRYAPYITQAETELARTAQVFDDFPIPATFAFSGITGLSNEVRERLSRERPVSFGQLRKVRGVTPAAATLVLVHLRRAASDRASGPVENLVGNAKGAHPSTGTRS